jgi:asparagine synthase (glutamine-hydrolysing)
MCGIAGIVSAGRPVNAAAVALMTARMAHRGPDGEGLWLSEDGRVCLGHRRLAIIDRTPAGHQPMERGSTVLTFNGEIYNYLELRAELEAAGTAFRTRGDSEVVLAAYERWGEGCVERFNGMFAFALLDRRRRILFCARDRFGEKPLLFHAGSQAFAFASEYKALLALDGVATEIDSLALVRFLETPATGLDDGRATLFPAILQLLPAERMVVELDGLAWRAERYWAPRPDRSLAGLDIAAAASCFRDLLTDSVRLRLRSDVPVGSCLSGGLDSGTIVGLARRLLGEGTDYHVFTGRFPDTPADEWSRAGQVVEATAAISHVVEPGAAGFLADLADFVWANELPVGSTSQYAQYCVFRLAREAGVTVLLDGQGADEMLGGYEQYFRVYLASLPADERRAEESRIRARYPHALATPKQRLSRALPHRLRHLLGSRGGRGSDPLFGVRHDLAMAATRAGRKAHKGAGDLSPLADALTRDSLSTHLPTLLRYGDRNSMAHSREVRLPFCDHRLFEFALSLAPGVLMGDAQTKRLLREAARGLLPEPVRIHWNKQGFLPPQGLWFRQGLAAKVEEVLEDPGFSASGLWHRPWWRRALTRFRAGEDHLAWVLWRPLMVEAWRRHFLQRAAALAPISPFGAPSP